MNNNAKKFLIQVLKNQLEEFKHNDNIEKGASKIRTFNITYLNEYERTKFNKEIDKVLFIKPSMENTFSEFVFNEIFELIIVINSEKHVCFPVNSCPKLCIANEIFEFKSKIIVITKKEKFIKIPHIIIFITKLDGDSILEYVK